jgi:hypothetical protein
VRKLITVAMMAVIVLTFASYERRQTHRYRHPAR